MAEVIGLQLNIDTKGSNATLGEVKQDIKAINAELAKTSRGSEAYAQLASKLSHARAEIGDFKEDLVALHPEKLASSFVGLGQSIAGGFAAAQGAMALFGAESEDVQKQLLKVQAGIAIVHGITAATEGWAGVQRILNVVMAASPIVAITAAVVALGGAIAYLTKGVTDDTEEWKKNNKELQTSIDKTEEYGKKRKQVNEDVFNSEKTDLYKKRIALARQLEDELVEIEKNKNKQIEDLGIVNYRNSEQEIYIHQKKVAAIEKTFDAQKKERRKLFADELRAAQIADTEKQMDAAELAVKEEEKRVSEERKRASEARQKENEDAWKRRREQAMRENEEMKEIYNDLLNSQKNATEVLLLEPIKEVVNVSDQLIADMQKQFQAQQAMIDMGISSLGTYASLFEKGTAANKAFAIAEIGASTAKGFMNALTIAQAGAAGTGPLAPITMPIFYATQLAAVLAAAGRAKAILGGGGGGVSAPRISGGGQGAPTLNNVGIGVTDLGKDSQGNFTGDTKQQVVKAYVVESELSKTQKKVASIVKKSKI